MSSAVIELIQFGGPELELDEIRHAGRRIGFLPHCENAVARFVRLLSKSEQAAIRGQCATIRAEQGRPAIAATTMQPPDPKDMARAEAKERRAKR